MSQEKTKKKQGLKEQGPEEGSGERTKSSMLQAVVITFSDGTTASFTGPAVVFEDGEKSISNVSFSRPRAIPDDCSWGKI